jgi:hypothetical protein
MGDVAKEVAIHPVAEAPAEDPEGAGLVAEAPRSFGRGDALDEVGSQRLILALAWVRGLAEEALFRRKRM